MSDSAGKSIFAEAVQKSSAAQGALFLDGPAAGIRQRAAKLKGCWGFLSLGFVLISTSAARAGCANPM